MVMITALARIGASAQESPSTNVVNFSEHSVPETGTKNKAWSFSASVYGYLVPDQGDYVQPTLTVDRNWMHLEARYNYENLNTGSAWAGYHLSAGKRVSLEFTPMLGGVFGDTTGVAPGYEATLSWWKLELYSEGEYVFDTGDSANDFFYTWSELSLAPTDWFRLGMVVQRTKLRETKFDLERGFLAGFSYRQFSVTTYVFNPGASQPSIVMGLGAHF